MDESTVRTLGSAALVVLGIFLTKGVDALIKWRREQRTDCSLEDERADKAYLYVNSQWRERVVSLESEVIELRKAYDQVKTEAANEHAECIRVQTELKSELAWLKRQIEKGI